MDKFEYRKALGKYPTGVALITAVGSDDHPLGMVVGTFSSVSLEPRLVSFMPDKGSTTFPAIREAKRFAVNVLSADHIELCRKFAKKEADRWSSAEWVASSAIPRLSDALLWLECEIVSVHEEGDHYIVIGEVQEIGPDGEGSPLIFFGGGYGQFSGDSLVLEPEMEIIPQIRIADIARAEMESVARATELECVAQAIVGDELVFIASATPPGAEATDSHVGVRIPLIPPRGSLFAAWPRGKESPWRKWMSGPAADDRLEGVIERVRNRGWSVWLASDDAELNALFDAVGGESFGKEEVEKISTALDNLGGTVEPDEFETDEIAVRFMGAPVFGPDGSVAIVLRLLGFPPAMPVSAAQELAATLVAAADRVTALAGGSNPRGAAVAAAV